MNPEEYFFAIAPGSTEMYLIPNVLKTSYLEWCQCEFFDNDWRGWSKFFKINEIIFKRMSKQACPHCQALQNINHDDGYGYSEDKRHSQQCFNCLNVFYFETIVSVSYFIYKTEEEQS